MIYVAIFVISAYSAGFAITARVEWNYRWAESRYDSLRKKLLLTFCVAAMWPAVALALWLFSGLGIGEGEIE